eukprot:159238_1
MLTISFNLLLVILYDIDLIHGDKSQFNGFNYLGHSWGYPYTYNSSTSYSVIRSMVNQTNNNWIQFCFLWGQKNANSTDIYRLSSTPTDSDVMSAINFAHSIGLKIVLRPGINPQDGEWRGQIGKNWNPNAPQWQQWFNSYQSMITHYASMATTTKVEMFEIGFEYAATLAQTTLWEQTIAAIKQKYFGPLRYGANHGEEGNVGFWDKLDYIGIDAYYQLDPSNSNPSLTDLQNAWKQIIPGLASLSQKYNGKEIIFAEIGYCSNQGTNVEPWNCWDSKTPNSEQAQANCYEAMFNTVYQESWFKGVFFWDWSTDPKDAGASNNGYNPSGKSAAAVCKQNFS